MLFDEDSLAFPINDVAVVVDEVAFLIDTSSHIVIVGVSRTALQDYVAIRVLIEYTDDILDIETLARVVQELRHITIIELFSVELLATQFVDDMTITPLDEPAKSVHSATLLVYVEALLGLQELWYSSPSALVVLELEITDEIMRVEVELFDAEWSRQLTLVIEISSHEELLFRMVLKNVALRVLQVTTDIGGLARLITVVSLAIL